jgi:hypothetical protein
VECVCDPTGALTRSRRVVRLCIVLCLCEAFCFFSRRRTVPACSFYSLKEVQGYKRLVCGVILAGEAALGPRGGLIRWRRGLYCGGMASLLQALLLHVQACVPLLKEWFLSFGIVATCPVIPGPMAGVACSSLWFG